MTSLVNWPTLQHFESDCQGRDFVLPELLFTAHSVLAFWLLILLLFISFLFSMGRGRGRSSETMFDWKLLFSCLTEIICVLVGHRNKIVSFGILLKYSSIIHWSYILSGTFKSFSLWHFHLHIHICLHGHSFLFFCLNVYHSEHFL